MSAVFVEMFAVVTAAYDGDDGGDGTTNEKDSEEEVLPESGIRFGLSGIAGNGERTEVEQAAEEEKEHRPDTSGFRSMLTNAALRAGRERWWEPRNGV